MKHIKMILRKHIGCDEKLKLIEEYINIDKENNLWHHNTVRLTDKELKDLNKSYGKQVIKNMIESLDLYIYSKWDKYKNHKTVIMNWLKRASVKKLPETYLCSASNVHRVWERCECFEF